jgi:DNA-binding response OmpR family regulator
VAARIAVIDDDADFRRFMVDALEDQGWEVLPCGDVPAAYGLLRDTAPDVILLDLRLDRRIAGWDFLTFLQLHPALHRIPVVLCTAAIDELHHRKAWLQAHNIPTLTKPFDLEELYTLVQSILVRRDATRSLAAPA